MYDFIALFGCLIALAICSALVVRRRPKQPTWRWYPPYPTLQIGDGEPIPVNSFDLKVTQELLDQNRYSNYLLPKVMTTQLTIHPLDIDSESLLSLLNYTMRQVDELSRLHSL